MGTKITERDRVWMRDYFARLDEEENVRTIGRPAGCRGCSRLLSCEGTASCPFEPGSSRKYPLPRRREAIEHTRAKRANTTR